MTKRIVLSAFSVLLISGLIYTSKYSLRYMHWSTKSNGYPDLYNQTDSYSFSPVNVVLKNAHWQQIGTDVMKDGDIPNWPDLKELSVVATEDSIWIRFTLHNYLDLNEPMVSIAFEKENGNNWYGTVDFNYQEIISAGYYRDKDQYFGYNFAPDKKGICSLKYDLNSNSLFLGIPSETLKKYADRNFVASVGNKGLWNDDLDSLIPMERLFMFEN